MIPKHLNSPKRKEGQIWDLLSKPDEPELKGTIKKAFKGVERAVPLHCKDVIYHHGKPAK